MGKCSAANFLEQCLNSTAKVDDNRDGILTLAKALCGVIGLNYSVFCRSLLSLLVRYILLSLGILHRYQRYPRSPCPGPWRCSPDICNIHGYLQNSRYSDALPSEQIRSVLVRRMPAKYTTQTSLDYVPVSHLDSRIAHFFLRNKSW